MIFDFKKNRAWSENLSIVLQLGLTMAGSVLFCFFVGRRLDRWMAMNGPFTAAGLLFGIVGGAVVVYRQIMEIIGPVAEDAAPGDGPAGRHFDDGTEDKAAEDTKAEDNDDCEEWP